MGQTVGQVLTLTLILDQNRNSRFDNPVETGNMVLMVGESFKEKVVNRVRCSKEEENKKDCFLGLATRRGFMALVRVVEMCSQRV